jgi:hypothetical protein
VLIWLRWNDCANVNSRTATNRPFISRHYPIPSADNCCMAHGSQAAEKEKVTSISVAVFGLQLTLSVWLYPQNFHVSCMTVSLSYFYFGRHHVSQGTPRATGRVSRYRQTGFQCRYWLPRCSEVEVLCSNSVLKLSLFCESRGPYKKPCLRPLSLGLQQTFWSSQRPGCTNPGRQVARTNKFYTVAPNIGGFWVWNLLHVTLLSSRILRCS